ncbi:MAG: Putative N-acetylgalactosaminyl-diphosphoundecaprenol glucuronosyltransferase [uncultured Sulfurovum sp.]|uniref:N-acetylgalactosaminyl-diphosphoundecaprenol glucuronosyltransferase n=1 Tax=uncultured Sulfurovum sp. TaxID=269237 RepID=A0A6S6TCC3_9BACT|nr:MAG: Putative N-acetylgalactosaminyl-diphosphoundecaprenol glucuronosyltransferase [uncultured Sulfurovum sp.]
MLVSIITPSYNAQDYLKPCIESVLSQTYTDWEMLIVDDCSSDNSREIIEAYAKKDSRIKPTFLQKNVGAAMARNDAIATSEGHYIAFLDSDDTWIPHKLEKQLKFMQKNDIAFSYSSYYTMSETGENTGEFIVPARISYESILKTCSIGCLTAIYDVKKLGKTYMINASKGEDLALWLNIMKQIKVTKGIVEPLAHYRIQSNSLSSNKLNAAKAQWHVYREAEGLSILKSSYYMLHYAYHGFMKYR